ncbi:MAG: transposase [Deltaproteobacteria bacterium]|nr:transposase [Deltaproteobacteria bacterium]
MSRGPRIDFPGALHHVFARGIEKRDIYFDDYDRSNFLGRVGVNLAKWNMRCSAWALMPNHFHLLIRSDRGCLPSFMHCLLTGYSRYFNDRHKRVGHLFQNRYKSPIVENIGHCREVVRYIHLNPLRSGIVPSVDVLEDYSWTGHKRIVRGGSPEWQDTGLLLEGFHGSLEGSEWIRNYREFLEAAAKDAMEISGLEDMEDRTELDEIRPQAINGPHEIFTDLLQRISASHGVPVERVLSKDRDYIVVNVRRAVLKKCMNKMEIPIAQLARWIGMKENSARYLLNSCR